MSNLTFTPFPTYVSNKPAAAVMASLIGLSLVAWVVQSIQARFKPRRPMILILLSHSTIFIELILRASLSFETRNSRAAFTATSVLLAVGQRMIILANYDLITQVDDPKTCRSRAIIIGSVLCAVGSAILTAPAGALSYRPNTLKQSFRLRQAAAAIVLCMTILFYPIWIATKLIKRMTIQAIVLLIISSVCSVIVAVFLQVTSIPYYYVAANKHEFWFYIFQLTPIAISLFTWSTLHPKRCLVSTSEPENQVIEDLNMISRL